MKHFLFTLCLWPLMALAGIFAPLVVLVRPNAFDSLDRLACALTGGRGTVSAWAWENKTQAWAKMIIRITDRIDSPGHCERAYKRENP